jgi:DNA-directed RNA polymerase specialized sigma24 family protein
MPRKKRKTDLDRPVYRPPSPLAAFTAGVALGRIVDQCGMADVRAVLELIERRCSQTRDAWKTNAKPMTAATAELVELPTATERRRAPGYRRHREDAMDSAIRRQERDRELEAGLAVIVEREERIPGYRAQVAEIVDRVEAEQSVAQIAEEMGIHPSTVERRLRDVRNAAVASAEAEQLSSQAVH